MTENKESSKTPANDETPEQSENMNAGVNPSEDKPVDPKEVARQRSKEDLARKRRNLRGKRGNF